MKADITYFILSRTIFDSSIWRASPEEFKLFIYLIGQARFKKQPHEYPTFSINRGELLTSLSQISEDNQYITGGRVVRWSRAKCSRMLAQLTEYGLIELLADTYGTHIKIINYNSYQSPETYKRTQPKHNCKPLANQVQTTCKQDATHLHTTKERKKDQEREEREEGNNAAASPPIPKIKIFDFVYLEKSEIDTLAKDLGPIALKYYTRQLDGYLTNNPHKRLDSTTKTKYLDHAKTIRNWANRDKVSGEGPYSQKSKIAGMEAQILARAQAPPAVLNGHKALTETPIIEIDEDFT